MSDDLKAKAKVALDLFRQGADEVEIKGTDIKLVRRRDLPSPNKSGSGTPQFVIQNNPQATAHAATNITASFSIVREQLRETYGEDKKFAELEKRLDLLEGELKKDSPNKKAITQILHWLLDFGLDAFLKIVPILSRIGFSI